MGLQLEEGEKPGWLLVLRYSFPQGIFPSLQMCFNLPWEHSDPDSDKVDLCSSRECSPVILPGGLLFGPWSQSRDLNTNRAPQMKGSPDGSNSNDSCHGQRCHPGHRAAAATCVPGLGWASREAAHLYGKSWALNRIFLDWFPKEMKVLSLHVCPSVPIKLWIHWLFANEFDGALEVLKIFRFLFVKISSWEEIRSAR